MMTNDVLGKRLARALRALKIAAYVFPFVVLGYVAVKALAPSGVTTLTYAMKHEAGGISQLEPAGRVEARVKDLETGEYYQKIIADPVYFDVFLPRNFAKATVTLTYQNAKHPIVEIGGRVSKDTFQFDLQEIENRLLENLNPVLWKTEQRGDFIFAQKPLEYRNKSLEEIAVGEKRTFAYTDANDFLNRYNGKDGRLTRFNYDFYKSMPIPDYAPAQEDTVLDVPLRGGQVLWAYAEKGESLSFRFTVEDVNLKDDADYFTVKLQRLGKTIAEVSSEDDGDDTASEAGSGERDVAMSATAPETGYYAVQIDATQDMFIKKIVTRQHQLLLGKQVVLAGNEAYWRVIPDLATGATTLYFYGKTLDMSLSDEVDTQHIVQDSYDISLTKNNRRRSINYGEARVRPLRVDENGVVVSTDGYFAFTPEALAYPPSDVDVTGDVMNFQTNLHDYDYILARNTPVTYEDEVKGWKQASASFELGKLARVDDRTVQFLISARGLDQLHNEIMIKRVTVTLESDPITPKKIIQKIWQKLK